MTTNPQSVDEKILLKQLQRGERKAYDYLWSKYKPPLYYKILQRVRDPLDAEDIITETFSRVYSKINDFKPTYKLSTWIFTIAINLSTDLIREKNIRPSNTTELDVRLKYDYPDPEEDLIYKEKIELFNKALSSVKNEVHKMSLTYFLEGFQYDEIAQMLNIPIGTVKASIFRAKEHIKNIFPKYDVIKEKREEKEEEKEAEEIKIANIEKVIEKHISSKKEKLKKEKPKKRGRPKKRRKSVVKSKVNKENKKKSNEKRSYKAQSKRKNN